MAGLSSIELVAPPRREGSVASGGPPDRMSPKHRLIAMLVAAGQSNVEIAETVGLHPSRIATIAGSPLFQALVREFQSDMVARISDVTARLHAEAGPTLAKLLSLRDGAAKEETQLAAANSLADRIPALSRKALEGERTLRVLLSADVEPLVEAIALSRGLPAAPGAAVVNRGAGAASRQVKVVAGTNGAPHAAITAPPIDELLAHWPSGEDAGVP
jgi:hypothetical protein